MALTSGPRGTGGGPGSSPHRATSVPPVSGHETRRGSSGPKVHNLPCAYAGELCVRTNVNIPPLLARSSASKELLWRAEHASAAYEAGDFHHAEGILHDILAQTDELADSLSDVERVSWKLWAQLHLAEVIWSRPGTPEQRAECVQDAWDIAAAVAGETNGDNRLVDLCLDGIFVLAMVTWAKGDIDGLAKLKRFYETPGSAQCRCGYQIRLHLLHGLLALATDRLTVAEGHFLDVKRYHHASHHYSVVARLALAECALRAQMDEGRQGAELQALEHLASVDRAHSKGVGIGALLAWLPHFPLAQQLATARYRWQADPQPVMSLGRTRTQEPVRSGQVGLRLTTFGPGEVVYRGAPIDFGGQRKALVFLVYLAMHPEGVDESRTLVDLWPSARTAAPIDKAVHACRALLGSDALMTRGGVFRLRGAAEGEVYVDCAQYEGKFVRALTLAPQERFEALMLLKDTYRGPFLHGLDGLWESERRRHYQEAQSYLLYQLAGMHALNGQTHLSIQFLEQCLEVDPLDDRAVAAIARQMDQLGLRSGAALRLRNHRDRIRKIFEMEPSPQIREIFERFQNAPDEQLTAAFSVEDLLAAIDRPVGLNERLLGGQQPMPQQQLPGSRQDAAVASVRPNGSAFLR